MGRCPTPRKGEAALDLPKNSLRSFFCTHESYIMRLNLCVKAANYYKQTLAMEDYNNGI